MILFIIGDTTLSNRKKRTPKSSLKLSKKDPPSNSLTRAYGYVRVSTEEQARSGVSLDMQKSKIRAWAILKDLELIDIYADEGVSGKDLNRPALSELLYILKDKTSEALIVYKLDRLTRKTQDLLHLVEDLFESGNTRLISITEDIDTSTPMGKFFLTMIGAMAQMERELIVERTKAALAHKKEQGDSLGHIPYGFKRIDGQLLKEDGEQKTLRSIKRWRKEGLSYGKIARRLNEKDIPTRRSNAKWHASTIHFILNNR